jgi:hypothetical protein
MRDQGTRCSEEGCNEVAVSRASAHEGEGVVIYTGLTEWLAKFERLHRQVFRSVSLSATEFTTGSPAFSRPRSLRPRSPWHGWRPNTTIGWISSRSFKPYNGRWEV